MPSTAPATRTAPGDTRKPLGAALWANLAIIYVVWGSTYFGIAIAIETMPPFLMADPGLRADVGRLANP